MLATIVTSSFAAYLLEYYDLDAVQAKYNIVTGGGAVKQYPIPRKPDVMGVNVRLGVKCRDMQRNYQANACCTPGADETSISLPEAPASHWNATCKDTKDTYWVDKDGTPCCGDSDEIADVYNMQLREWDNLSHDPDIVASQMRNDDIFVFANLVGDKLRALGHVPLFYLFPSSRLSVLKCLLNGVMKASPDPGCPNERLTPTTATDPDFDGLLHGGVSIGITIAPKCHLTSTCTFDVTNRFRAEGGFSTGMQAQGDAITGKMYRTTWRTYPREEVQWMLDDPVYSKGIADFAGVPGQVTEQENGEIGLRIPEPFNYGSYGFAYGILSTSKFADIEHLTTLIALLEASGVESVKASMDRGNSIMLEVPAVNGNVAFLDGNANGTPGGRTYLFHVEASRVKPDGTLYPQSTPELMDDFMEEMFTGNFEDAAPLLRPLIAPIKELMKQDILGEPFPPFVDFKKSFNKTLRETMVPTIDVTDFALVFDEVVKMADPMHPTIQTLAAGTGTHMDVYAEAKRRLLASYEATKDGPFHLGIYARKAFKMYPDSSDEQIAAFQERKGDPAWQAFHTEDDVIAYSYIDGSIDGPVNNWGVDFPHEPRFHMYETVEEVYRAFACIGWDYTFHFTLGKSSGFTCP